ncbi:MAG: hypothetical protein DRN03_04175 [Thermoplasmata archaeon]|nr:MAG: hypothetical protein DRN03_04175 [Thermoplasmata archaeon]
MEFKARLRKVIPKLRKYKGIAWVTTVVSFFGLVIASCLMGVGWYIELANLIAMLYFVFVSIIAETEHERNFDIICVLFFLFFLLW